MAEDVVLRLRAENEDLKRKLEESRGELQKLRTEVESLDSSSTSAGDAIDRAVAEMREQFEAARADLDRLEQATSETGQATEDLAGEIRQGATTAEEYRLQVAKTAGALKLLHDAGQILSDGLDGIAEKTGANTREMSVFTDQIRAAASPTGPIDTLKNLFRALAITAQDVTGVIRRQPEALARLGDALEAVGLDAFAQQAREAAVPLQAIAEQQQLAAERADQLAESIANLRDQVRPSSEEIFNDLRTVRAVFEEITAAGEPTEQQIIKIGEAAQDLASRFRLVGKEVPEDIARLAEESARLVESQKEAEEQAKKLASSLRREEADALREAAAESKRLATATESLAASFRLSDEELAQRTRLLVDAVALTEQQGTVTETATQRIQTAIIALIEKHEEAGEAIPEELAKVAEAYDVAATQAEAAVKRITDATAAASARVAELAEEAAQSVRDAQEGATQAQPAPVQRQAGGEDARRQVETLRQEVESLNKAQQEGLVVSEEQTQRLTQARGELIEAESRLKDEASETGQVFFRSAQQAIASQEKVNDLLQGAREQVSALGDELDDPAATSSLQRIVDGFDAVTSQVGVTGSEIETFTRNFQAEVDRLRQQATASFDATAEGAEKGKEGVEKLGEAAKDASESADELGEATKAAADRAKELADVEIQKLPDSIREATAAAEEHIPILNEILLTWGKIRAVIAETGGRPA